MSPEQRRLPYALLLSLLIHTLLLSLVFGGEGTGLPGFGFPWQARRIEVPDLRLLLVPAQVAGTAPAVAPVAGPLPQAPSEQRVAGGPAPTPSAPAPRADPGADGPRDRAGGQFDGRGQANDRRGDRRDPGAIAIARQSAR